MLRTLLISPILLSLLLTPAVHFADEIEQADAEPKKAEKLERKLRVARILRDLKAYNGSEEESNHQIRVDIVMLKASPENLKSRNFRVGDLSLADYLISLANVSNETDAATGVLKDSAPMIEAFRSARQADALTQLVSPSIITFSGREATFQSIGKIARPIVQERGDYSVEFFDVGSTVKLTPTYQDDGKIQVDIIASFAEVNPEETFVAGVPPEILERSVTSNATVRKGETMFIARRVPPLGDQDKEISEAEARVDLILLITPKLID